MNKSKFEPIPLPSTLLAVLPGLLLALSRLNVEWLRPFLPPASIVVFVLPALAIPIAWWRHRPAPIWTLLPAGALVWLLVYYLAIAAAAIVPWRMQAESWMIMVLLQLALGAVLFGCCCAAGPCLRVHGLRPVGWRWPASWPSSCSTNSSPASGRVIL